MKRMNPLAGCMLLLALLLTLPLPAQTPYELIDEDLERVAGHYHHYEVPLPSTHPTRPEGYQPFYISHYGRHGCRWHTSELVYQRPLVVLRQLEEDQVLTPKGKQLLEMLSHLAEEARGKEGNLTPRGEREHRGIAERMYATYPEIFQAGADIECRSTDVPRCILSMCAFNERLKELEPALSLSRTAYARDLSYMIHRPGAISISKRAKVTCDSLQQAWLSPERFIRELVSDKDYPVTKPEKLMYQTYQLASILQDTGNEDLRLFDYFTDEELDALWRCENAYVYLTQGPSLEYGDAILEDAKPLLDHIVRTADDVIAGRSQVSATLRFGHDQALVPLYALMGMEGTCDRVRADQADQVWNVSTVTPMATNIQFIFFRKNTHETSHPEKEADIKVRILHNEKDVKIPVDGAPFYDWKSLRKYLMSR